MAGRQPPRPQTLERLVQDARNRVVTPTEREQQRQSFAYGNVSMEHPTSREAVAKAADTLRRK